MNHKEKYIFKKMEKNKTYQYVQYIPIIVSWYSDI